MNPQTIAIDIDDVLADSTDALRVFVNQKHGRSLQRYHYMIKTGTYWGYYESVWEQHDINGDGIIDEFHAQYATDQSHVLPIAGAVEALLVLSEAYRLIAISSRASDQQQATERWIKQRFGDVFSSVACIDTQKNKTLTKGEACKIAGARYLIDDNIEHCKSAKEYQVQPILFGNYGWHDDSQLTDGVIRCKDWTAVLEYFNGRG